MSGKCDTCGEGGTEGVRRVAHLLMEDYPPQKKCFSHCTI